MVEPPSCRPAPNAHNSAGSRQCDSQLGCDALATVTSSLVTPTMATMNLSTASRRVEATESTETTVVIFVAIAVDPMDAVSADAVVVVVVAAALIPIDSIQMT